MNPLGQTEITTGHTTQLPPGTTLNINIPEPGKAATMPVSSAPDENTQRRINDLMSRADRAQAESARYAADMQTAQNEIETLKRSFQEQLQNAASTTRILEEEKARLNNELALAQAQAMKLQTLAERPHLLPYAEFLPATIDPQQMQAAITKFEEIRRLDLERANPPTTGTTESKSSPPIPFALRGIVPNTMPQMLQPTTQPLPQDTASAMQSFEARVRALNPQSPEYSQQRAALIAEAEAMARQQYQV